MLFERTRMTQMTHAKKKRHTHGYDPAAALARLAWVSLTWSATSLGVWLVSGRQTAHRRFALVCRGTDSRLAGKEGHLPKRGELLVRRLPSGGTERAQRFLAARLRRGRVSGWKSMEANGSRAKKAVLSLLER